MTDLRTYVHPINHTLLSEIPEGVLDLPKIPPMSQFSRHELMYLDGHKWMANCRFILVHKTGSCFDPEQYATESLAVDSLLDFEEKLYNDCVAIGNTCQNYNAIDPKSKLLAFDTENTGLDVTVKIVGGKRIRNLEMIGISLAVSSTVGYYLPICHTGDDGVPNWSLDEIREFMSRIMTDRYHLLYFNAKYDCSVLLINGIRVNPLYTDLYLIHRLMGNYEFYTSLMNVNSLKKIAESVLDRKMLEINQLLGSKDKKNIRMDRLPAVNALCYAASDAVNTYTLFDRWILKDIDKRSPYKHQRESAWFTMRSAYHAMGMISNGLPLDHPHAFKMLKTVIRREVLLERKLMSFLGEDLNPSSNEQMAKRIVEYIRKFWVKDEDSFLKYVENRMGIGVTIREFKKIGRKVTYCFGSEVAKNLIDNMKDHTFLPPEAAETLTTICSTLMTYRSLCHEKIYYLGLIRNAKKDDRNYSYCNIDLKIEGTDTGRFSNERAKGVDRILWDKGSPKIVYGDGVVTGINAQGFSHDKYVLSKARKIVNLPRSEEMVSVDAEVEKRLFTELSEV